MRILVIGGTRFVGLAITRELLRRGHDVTVFHRSDGRPVGTESARHIKGDRDSDLHLLQGSEWDAVVDVCAYRPHQVADLAYALNGNVGRFVFISTVSVYADQIPSGSDENAELASVTVLDGLDPASVPIDGVTYGPLKVLCEKVVTETFPAHLIIRPTYVIGPDDYTNRFSHWVERIHSGGIVEVPLPKDASLQYIDARDLASFTVDQLEAQTQGAFHVATPSRGASFGEVIETIASTLGGDDLQLNWITVDEALTRADEFPLWNQGEVVTMLEMDTTKALTAGLQVRALAETVHDIVHGREA